MTATRMPFLARLAPGAREGASSVRAALPSRFAPAEAAVVAVEAPVEQPPVGQTHDAFGEAAPAVVFARPAVPEPVETPAAHAEPRSGIAFERPLATPPCDPMPVPVTPAVTLAHPIATSPQADSQHELPPRVMTTVHTEPVRMSAVPAAATPAAPYPRRLAEVRPPLRESALAQRPEAQHAEAPPAVVHVSIDRIDLRLPAPPPPEQRAATPRRRAATVPLADYLRQRGGS